MSNTEKAELATGALSHLSVELDGANNMMCFWVDDTEISHYLMSHINDKGNMEDWQESLCVNAAFVIDELRDEVKRLRNKVFELDCKVTVCVCCKTAYANGTDNAEIIEKMGVCENCITDI